MKVWQLAYPHNLQHVIAPDLKLTSDKVKVKVTKALVTETDIAVYSGAIKVKAPFIPGRFAIGQVTETDENSFLQRGQRVYLSGVTEDELAPDGLLIAGETSDGFYHCASPCITALPGIVRRSCYLTTAATAMRAMIRQQKRRPPFWDCRWTPFSAVRRWTTSSTTLRAATRRHCTVQPRPSARTSPTFCSLFTTAPRTFSRCRCSCTRCAPNTACTSAATPISQPGI